MRWVFVLVMAAPFVSSCYLAKQGYRQLGLLTSREPIEDVMKSDRVSSEQRKKLEFTRKTLAYAESEGMSADAAYKDFVSLAGEAVSYTVQAAKPTEMRLKTWWFPVVGVVPYLGFFDKVDRDEEAAHLLGDGYEIYKGGAAAYSSLGWFSDPVYSSMLQRSDVELAHLYFHELTHRTLWLKDGVEFNENLAEYVADKLTDKYFQSIKRDRDLIEFYEANADYGLFRSWLKKLRSDLERNLLETEGQPDMVRVAQKSKVISLALSSKPAFKRVDFVGSGPWNNARILAAGLYSPDVSKFKTANDCYRAVSGTNKIGNFLKALKKASENTKTGFEALQAMCLPQDKEVSIQK